MVLIVCIDDNGGMMFNHRRQSQDKVVRERILTHTFGKVLWMNHYSKRQFIETDPQINVDDAFLSKATCNDYCFVENLDVVTFEELIHQIIVFKWNRVYPSDFKFNIPLSQGVWKLCSSVDFTGNSHEKITEEVYKR